MGISDEEMKRRVLDFLGEKSPREYKQKTLSQKLDIPKSQYRHFKQLLRELSNKGKIERQKNNRYSAPQEKRVIEGELSVTSKGFGFVLMPDEKDIFISYENLANAMDGDRVRSLVFKRSFGKNPEGRILEVLERGTENIVGVFHRTDSGGVVHPEDERMRSPLYIPPEKISPEDGGEPPKDGMVVVARLEDWADPRHEPQGFITEVLGAQDTPKMDLMMVAKSRDLDLEFPDRVMQATEDIPKPDWDRELERRKDLREVTCFTIDPEDAKDYDDAVSLRQLDNGRFELGVHIADVSHFVKENSPVDQEAWRRGTSVYFVRHVIPMLPERLSNNLCSLKPDEDRLSYSVLMEVDSSGEVHDYSIEETVIRSNHRFTYEEVEAIIKGEQHKYANTIHLMQMMNMALQRQREELGSIDFDIPEPIFSLDENGIPYEVRPKERLHAHRLIEEFMLLANRTVAHHIGRHRNEDWPFVYRIHPEPEREDIESFLSLLRTLGINYQVIGEIEPEDFRNILEIVENMEYKDFIEKVALRSMTKAKYSTENQGHFGLAFDTYTHFTSPIRRYPDLIVHRLLKRYATQGKPGSSSSLLEFLESTCENSSAKEVNAMEAEREYAKIKSMQFLEQKVGEEFDGIISGVTSFGMFVELTHYLVEGLVPLSEMRDDYYIHEPEKYQLIGKQSKKQYRLGDRVRIQVARVSVEDRQAEFLVVDGGDG